MFEKNNTEIAPSKKDGSLEDMHSLLGSEIELFKKLQENIPEKEKNKFEKIRRAFVAVTTGALMLGATGCGVPFMIGAEAKNMESVSTSDVLLGPLGHPSYFFKKSEPERQEEIFGKENISLTVSSFHNTNNIYRYLEKSGWSKMGNAWKSKYRMEINENAFEKGSYSVVLFKGERTEQSKRYSWVEYDYTEVEKIEKVSFDNLLGTMEKMVSSIN